MFRKTIALLLSVCMSSCMTIPASANTGGQAKDVSVDTSSFNKNLSSSDSTVQHALATLDQLVAGGGSSSVNWGSIGGLITSQTDLNTKFGTKQDTLTSNSIQHGLINWSSLNLDIQAAGVNWSSLNKNVQSAGINWSTIINKEMQTSGVNWASVLGQDLQRQAINWNSLNQDIKSAGINWASINATSLNGSGINWSNVTGIPYPPDCVGTACSLNTSTTINGHTPVTIDGTQTLSNKSITGGQITSAVATATALASAPTACNSGNYARGIDVNGNATGCTSAAAGNGTVTTVSVATANGISGSVANATTTPAITINPINSGGINWSSFPLAVQNANINWTDVQGIIKSQSVNWNDINSIAKINNGAINWSNFLKSVQNQNINWDNVNGLSPINQGGINWSTLNGVVNQAGINWNNITALQVNGTGPGVDQFWANGFYVNWSSAPTLGQNFAWYWPTNAPTTGQALVYGGNHGVNWSTISGGGTGASNWSQLQGDITLANWTSIAPFLNRGAINWADMSNGQSVNWGSGIQTAKQFNSVNVGTQGSLRLYDTAHVNWMEIFAPGTIGANINWTLPVNLPTTGQSLTWGGNPSTGGLNWTTITGGTGASNWSQLQGSAGLANWNSASSFIPSQSINWNDVNGLQPIKHGGINWNDMYPANQSVNWGSTAVHMAQKWVATGTGPNVNGTYIQSTVATPTITSCGSGPAVTGSGQWFTIVPGSGATGCTATWGTAWPSTPNCVSYNATAGTVPVTTSVSTTAITITQSGIASQSIVFMCGG